MFSSLGSSIDSLFSGFNTKKSLAVAAPAPGKGVSISFSENEEGKFDGRIFAKAAIPHGSIDVNCRPGGDCSLKAIFPNILPCFTPRAILSTDKDPVIGLNYKARRFASDLATNGLKGFTLSTAASTEFSIARVAAGLESRVERGKPFFDGLSAAFELVEPQDQYVIAGKASIGGRKVSLGLRRPTVLANGATLNTGLLVEWSKITLPTWAELKSCFAKKGADDDEDSVDDKADAPAPIPLSSETPVPATTTTTTAPLTTGPAPKVEEGEKKTTGCCGCCCSRCPCRFCSADVKVAVASQYKHNGWDIKSKFDTTGVLSLAVSKSVLEGRGLITASSAMAVRNPTWRLPLGLAFTYDA